MFYEHVRGDVTYPEGWVHNMISCQLIFVECWHQSNAVSRRVCDNDALKCHVGCHVEERNSVVPDLHHGKHYACKCACVRACVRAWVRACVRDKRPVIFI